MNSHAPKDGFQMGVNRVRTPAEHCSDLSLAAAFHEFCDNFLLGRRERLELGGIARRPANAESALLLPMWLQGQR